MKTHEIAFGALFLVAAAMSGCAQPTTGADVGAKDKNVARIIHEEIMRNMTRYKEDEVQRRKADEGACCVHKLGGDDAGPRRFPLSVLVLHR